MSISSSTPLPIEAIRDAFLEARTQRAPTLVVAPTGSGKSTRLPLWMKATPDQRVVIIEPRRVACRSLSTFVAKQLGEEVGQSVGYRVRFEDRTSPKTRILFVTPGVALRLLSDPSGEFAAAPVFIDEFHERGWEVDLAAATVFSRAPERLVMASATIDAEAIAQRFGAITLRAEGRSFPIDIQYRNAPAGPTRRDLEERLCETLVEMFPKTEGDALVFLPGRGEIQSCLHALRAVMPPDVEVLPLHGSLSPRDIERALGNARRGVRRITLATNIAETSLTLPNVRVVIDSGLMRSKVHRAGRTALSLVAAPQSSLDQRAGRAGRVAAGVCVRLFSKGFRPPAFATPEVERMELDDVILQASSLGFEGDAFDALRWPTPPPAFAVEKARERLAKAGALNGAGQPTPLGLQWSKMPIGSEVAALLHALPDAKTKGIMADLVALSDRDGSLFLPHARDDDDVAFARADLIGAAENEVEANVWALRGGDVKRHRLHRNRLEETRKLASRLRGLVGASASSPLDDDPIPKVGAPIARLIAERRPLAAFVRRPRAERMAPKRGAGEPWGNGEDEVWLKPWRPSDENVPETEAGPISAPKAGVVLVTRWMANENARGVRGYGGMLVPCGLEDLAAAKVGDLIIGDIKVDKGRRGTRPRIFGTVARTFAGVTLETTEELLKGKELTVALGDLIAQARLFPGVLPRAEQCLHTWRLGSALLPDIRDCPFDSPKAWFEHAVQTLGVETQEDLELLSDDDLIPQLAKVANLDDDEERRLTADFPATWTDQGATYRVQYDAARKVVRLVAEGKKAMKAKDPPAALVPRFRNLPVEIQRASRVKRLR